jgi:hypothetical protein
MRAVKSTLLAAALAALIALAAVGVFRGEFKETWFNGATL